MPGTARWGGPSAADRAAHHRLDRPRRLRVGRDAVRRAPRRPQGLRVPDALRRGLGALRRVRALLHRHGRPRSTTCSTVSRPSAAAPTDGDVIGRCRGRRRPSGCASARRSRGQGRTVVAFSGGADSALVARRRHRRARARPRTVRHGCVRSHSHPRSSTTAGPWRESGVCGGARCRPPELEDPAYVANGADRCYHCKASLLAGAGTAGRAQSPPSWCWV